MRDVAALAAGSFALAGYSMGGRLALHVALAHRRRVSRLVLVSTTAGIEDPASEVADCHALALEAPEAVAGAFMRP